MWLWLLDRSRGLGWGLRVEEGAVVVVVVVFVDGLGEREGPGGRDRR